MRVVARTGSVNFVSESSDFSIAFRPLRLRWQAPMHRTSWHRRCVATDKECAISLRSVRRRPARNGHASTKPTITSALERIALRTSANFGASSEENPKERSCELRLCGFQPAVVSWSCATSRPTKKRHSHTHSDVAAMRKQLGMSGPDGKSARLCEQRRLSISSPRGSRRQRHQG